MVKAEKWRYGIVLDAGSSGTRIHIYRWLRNEIARLEASAAKTLPIIESKDKWTKKQHVGLSTFAETPELVGTDHLQPLLDDALKYVPEEIVPETPIFLLATAGMRLLPTHQRDNILKTVCAYIRTQTKFLLPDCDLHVQVIPGETEGLYGWVAANYLLGGFDAPGNHDHGKGHHTYGFLDMGGASAQIAFAPNATEAEKHANDLTLLRLRTIDGSSQEHKVFVTSWLGFGVNEARRRYMDGLKESYGTAGVLEIPDPCLPAGLTTTLAGKVVNEDLLGKAHFLGTGKFDECLHRTLPLLLKDKPCLDEPCLINGVHVPAIDFDVNHFIGISQFWHTTHEIFEMDQEGKAYDFNTYQSRVRDFCQKDWAVIKHGIDDKTWGKKVDEEKASDVCFRASWLINMLHDGIGIPRVGIEDTSSSALNGTKELIKGGKAKGFLDPFQAVDTIQSTEVSWTLGKMVMYASADVPGLEGSLPVGFGSNEPGIPKDFHYPGGGRLQNISHPDSSSDGQSLTDQLHDTIFKSDASHRVPGFIFFLLIMIIAIFYLCGRDRRSRYFSSIFGSPSGMTSSSSSSGSRKSKSSPLPPSSLSSIFPISLIYRVMGRRKHGGVNYDRVMEDGGRDDHHRLHDPEDFELGEIDSDDVVSDEDGRGGHGTPSSSSRRSFKSTTTTAAGAVLPGRLAHDVMDRRGVVLRSESRENLDLANGSRSKSRNGSPTRLKTSISSASKQSRAE